MMMMIMIIIIIMIQRRWWWRPSGERWAASARRACAGRRTWGSSRPSTGASPHDERVATIGKHRSRLACPR